MPNRETNVVEFPLEINRWGNQDVCSWLGSTTGPKVKRSIEKDCHYLIEFDNILVR